VDLTWNAAPGATSYDVLRDGTKIKTLTGTSFSDTDRPPGTYRYTVVAVNGGTTSDPSGEATATVEADMVKPTVTPQASCDGRTLSEVVGPIEVTASDDRGNDVTAQVKVDGQTVFGPEAVLGSFRFDWDTRTTTNGPHTMQFIVRDAAGNETVMDCPWTVYNRALSVPITGPADGATVSGNVVIGFQPLADGASTGAPVNLSIDGASVASKTLAPYTFTWDTTKVAKGLHTMKADMGWMGYSGTMATSTIQVRVENVAPPQPSGLVAAYGFEETSGTSVTDSSGKSSTGTISGATSATGGKFGRALSFDGVNDLVTVTDSNLLDLAPGMTLEAWVKPTTVNDWRTVLLKERPGQLAYALYAATDSGRPMVEASASSQPSLSGSAARRWARGATWPRRMTARRCGCMSTARRWPASRSAARS
jgi:hypothetical protein